MSSLMGARDDRKVTPGITESSRPRAHMIKCKFYLSISTAGLATSMSALPILAVQKYRKTVFFGTSSFFETVCGQGWGCSPIKRDRELGSQRCEAVGLISTGNARCLRGRKS
jgi:hypothetical protein